MTRLVLIAATLTLVACVPQPPRETSGGPGYGYVEPRKVRVPELRRIHTMQPEKPIDGFEIKAIPAGAAGWKIQVSNSTGEVAAILWDESSFVASTGMAAGRLINGKTRKIDSAKAQPGTPVPPGASIIEIAFPEKFIGDEDLEGEIEDFSRGRLVEQDYVDRVNRVRRARYELIVGGKLYVTVQGENGKRTWVGLVVKPEEPADVEESDDDASEVEE